MKKDSKWLPMESAPKDKPILAWCAHEADPYFVGPNKLTIYGAHAEGMSHIAENGPHVIEWGGGWDDRSYEEPTAGYMPNWWFLYRSDFEVVVNPVGWMPIEEAPEFVIPQKIEHEPALEPGMDGCTYLILKDDLIWEDIASDD